MALGRADPGEFIILAIFTNEILYSVEVGAKAWMTTSADVVPFLKASFRTSSPTILDVAGENLLWRATMSARLASFPP